MKSYSCRVFLFFLIAVVASVVFLPALGGGFVLDDGFNILQNRLLYVDDLRTDDLLNATLSFHDGNGLRPLPMLSFALDYWRAGSMDPFTFKVTNLIVHGLTVFVLSLFFQRLLLLAGWEQRKAIWMAAVLALAWAVHPLQVSSVMYVVQRMQTMATLFVVLSLWAYLGMRQAQILGISRGRGQGLLVLLFAFLALGCKEDAVLLVLFFLALELTVLRFSAAQPDIARGLKQSYLLIFLLGALVYLFWVVPHYWRWDAYPTRDFSTLERLLSQGRVLVMYLGQIFIPLPDRMTFLYDSLEASRSLWRPWSTLPALLVLVGLMIWAWRWRHYRPLFSLGVMLFFAGHFITSNVIGLELAFEHRNHFPLVGAVLAFGDMCAMLLNRFSIGLKYSAMLASVLLAALGTITVSHAYTWGDEVRHGEKLVELMPESHRAWMQLSGVYFERYKITGDEAALEKSVEVIDAGLRSVEFPPLASNLVIYKSLLGTVTRADWERFLHILAKAPPSWQDKFAVWTLMNNVDRGFELDLDRVLQAIDILAQKSQFKKEEYQRIAVFIYKNDEPDNALPYFVQFAKTARRGDPAVVSIIQQLKQVGREGWAEILKQENER